VFSDIRLPFTRIVLARRDQDAAGASGAASAAGAALEAPSPPSGSTYHQQ
jgi:hypothetical protein